MTPPSAYSVVCALYAIYSAYFVERSSTRFLKALGGVTQFSFLSAPFYKY